MNGRGTYRLAVTHVTRSSYTFDPSNRFLSKNIIK